MIQSYFIINIIYFQDIYTQKIPRIFVGEKPNGTPYDYHKLSHKQSPLASHTKFLYQIKGMYGNW